MKEQTSTVDCILNKIGQIKNLMVDETGLDEHKVDDTAVDEIAVDEPGPHRLTKERLWALNPTDQKLCAHT